jgi:hypothetical protein
MLKYTLMYTGATRACKASSPMAGASVSCTSCLTASLSIATPQARFVITNDALISGAASSDVVSRRAVRDLAGVGLCACGGLLGRCCLDSSFVGADLDPGVGSSVVLS